jgi:sulfur-oxidizing protein SoxX
MRLIVGFFSSVCALLISTPALPEQPDEFCDWQVVEYAIPSPLCGLRGDALRGRALAADSHGGNCLACHQMPIPEAEFQGTVGPPLHGVGARYSAAQMRLRIVDEQQINPVTIMPGFYSDPSRANRVAGEYWRKTFLTAQQIEDLVVYLVSLK